MILSIGERESNVWVTVSGRLDSTASEALEDALTDLVNRGKINIVLNLQRVEYMSSSGLRVILSSLRKVSQLEGKLWLSGVEGEIEEILKLTGTDTVFPIFSVDDRETE